MSKNNGITKTSLILLLTIGFVIGNITGFFLGIFTSKKARDFFVGLFEKEREAVVSIQNEINRANFNLKYAGNWKIDTADEEYDPDHLFSIESPGSSFTMFIVFDSVTDPKENIKNQVEVHTSKLLKNPETIPFTQWGRYNGEGVVLRGKIMGILKGYIRVFSHSSQTKSFTVIEFAYDEDAKLVGPGFKLIESTFCLSD